MEIPVNQAAKYYFKKKKGELKQCSGKLLWYVNRYYCCQEKEEKNRLSTYPNLNTKSLMVTTTPEKKNSIITPELRNKTVV